MGREADLVDQAISGVLNKGLRTADIMQAGMQKVSTSEMGRAVESELKTLAA
jgi:3-isopropylmalate dehydrogenase